MIFIDQLQRTICLDEYPVRIVSLVPSQTELLVYLGLGEYLVGLTKFCIHPNDLRNAKTVVGGTKNVKYKKIAALKPDIILCNKEENTKEMISELELIAPVHISDIHTLKDCFELIKMYGDLFNRDGAAQQLVETIESKRMAFSKEFNQYPRVNIVYFIWKRPWMVAGTDTFINHMIGEAGYTNVIDNKGRYPEIDLNDPALAKADQIFLSSEPYPFKEKDVQELKIQFPNKEVVLIDGEMFSWYGSRLLQSFSYFKALKKKKSV